MLWHWPHFFLPTPPHLFTYSIHSRGNGGKEGRSLHEFSAALSLPMGIIRFLLRRKSMMDVMQGVPIGLRNEIEFIRVGLIRYILLEHPAFDVPYLFYFSKRSASYSDPFPRRSSLNGYVYVILNA